MHADALYHRLLAQEAEVDAAKAEGRPVPKFESVVPKKPIMAYAVTETELTPEQIGLLKARLEKVEEDDRPAEEQAFKAELKAKTELAGRIKNIWDQQAEERRLRKESGQQTTWDRVVGAVRGGDQKK